MMIRTTIVNDYTNANNSNVDRDSEGDIPVTQFSLYHQSSRCQIFVVVGKGLGMFEQRRTPSDRILRHARPKIDGKFDVGLIQ